MAQEVVLRKNSAGATIEMGVKGLSGLISNLYSADKKLQAEIRKINEQFGRETAQLASELAPRRTGRLASSYTFRLSKNGRTVYIYSDPQVFFGDGQPYYAPFVEFGTATSPAQPHLTPAFREMLPFYQEDVSLAIQRALRRQTWKEFGQALTGHEFGRKRRRRRRR